MKNRGIRFFLSCLCLLLLSVGCGNSRPKTFDILSGSENASLEPLLHEFGQKNGVEIVMHYKGSVDIMQELSAGDLAYDAIWPANSLWIRLGDERRRVKYEASIMTSPVVFGIRRSLAERLGFVGQDVRVRDILDAIRTKQLKFIMTSATQSNSGASAYLGFLYALLDQPDVLTRDHLRDPQLKSDIRELLAGINRSSGSSGWLKTLFLEGNYDAMVNYESMMIEANQELVSQGKEALYVVYPVDGIVMSDSPLGYIDRGEEKKEEFFQQLQAHLLSEDIQAQIAASGRRTGIGGITGEVDTRLFNPEWGIDVKRILSPITLPAAEVIRTVLDLYQTDFRKPSLTVFCLDFSGSMKGEGAKQLKQAMALLLDQEQAKQYLIHASSEDLNMVVPFTSTPLDVWKVSGNQPDDLRALLARVQGLQPGGGTNIYSAAKQGLQLMTELDLERYVPAILLMTDGKSKGYFHEFSQAWTRSGLDIPVFGILFGEASKEQLTEMTRLTRGRVFDGRHDLVNAFRKAKGYN